MSHSGKGTFKSGRVQIVPRYNIGPRQIQYELQYSITERIELPTEERTQFHSGYTGVDLSSLRECTSGHGKSHNLDKVRWENRIVTQKTLYEDSINFLPNWFGKLTHPL